MAQDNIDKKLQEGLLKAAEVFESIPVKPRLRPWQQATIDQILNEPDAMCDFAGGRLPDLDSASLTMRDRSKGPRFLFESLPHNPFESRGVMLSPRSFDTCDATLGVSNPAAVWEEDEAAVKNVVGHPKTHRPSKKRVKQQKKSKRANRRK